MHELDRNCSFQNNPFSYSNECIDLSKKRIVQKPFEL